MNVGRWAIVIIGCLLFFAIGFKAGEFVEAGGIAPGSVGDPLAAKSYVDKAVAEKIAQLQSQAEDLQAKVNTLQLAVEKLEAKPSQTVVTETTAPVTSNEQQGQNYEQPAQVTPQPTGKTATITAPSANIRKGPGTNFEIVAGLLNGKSVPVLSIENNWVYVDLGNTKGWVSKNLVEIK